MVLDKLINPQILRNKPHLNILVGFFFVFLAVVSTALVFPAEYSIIVVSMTSLMLLPYVIKNFELDELNIDLSELKISGELKRDDLEAWVRKCLRDGYTPKQIKNSLIENNLDKDLLLLYDLGILDEINDKYVKESNLLSRHSKTIEFYVYLFIGMFLAFMMLYVVAAEKFRILIFQHQLELIYGPGGYFVMPSAFYNILSNNLQVMLMCVMLSLLYGSGAILILAYNASIAGVFYGGILRSVLSASTFHTIVSFIPHTTTEILAYLIAAISGGILSKAVVETEPGSRKLLAKDGLKFLGLSLLILIVAALLEVRLM